MLSKGEMLFNSKGAYVVDKTDAYNLKEPTHILSSYDSHPILKSMGMNPGVRRTPDQDLKNENRLKNKLFGNGMIANHSGGSTVTTNSGINMDEVKQNLKTLRRNRKWLKEKFQRTTATSLIIMQTRRTESPVIA